MPPYLYVEFAGFGAIPIVEIGGKHMASYC
jgi:hypothetical protein